jgi:TolA-binding protein
VNKMSLTVNALQKQLGGQQEAAGAKLDSMSGQVQALNDSIDEIKARLARLEKTLQDVQTQEQSINANMQNLAPNPGGATAAPGDGLAPGMGLNAPNSNAPAAPPAQPPVVNKRGKPSAGVPMATATPPGAQDPTAGGVFSPPPGYAASDLYKTALSDYMAAKYTLAAGEFSEVIRLYSDDPLAGNAFYYQGEIDYRAGKYAAAVKDYDRVLEQFPDNSKVAVSHLHKGMALFELKQNDAGVRELRTLIARFPASPEATAARSKLNGMGVPIVPKQRP